MIELGVGADLFRLVGGLFWIVVLGALAAALLLPKRRTGKAIAVAVVLGLFAAFPGRWAWERKQVQDAYLAQRDKAEAIFAEHCKGAGEKIYRTVEGVEGILLMKQRPEEFNTYDQNAVDPYSGETRDSYILSFVGPINRFGVVDPRGDRPGYRYADAVDPADGKRYRYTAYEGLPPGFVGKRDGPMVLVKREPAPGPSPRYGVTYDDLATPDERAAWIAGSSLKVIDLQTNEVIAERIGYMIDKGQGNTGGGRQPWAHAERWACPSFPEAIRPSSPTRQFVGKVLKIKGEDK